MGIKIRLVHSGAYQLDGVEAEKVNRQLDSRNEFIEFNFEDAVVRVYRQYIVSVEWRGWSDARS